MKKIKLTWTLSSIILLGGFASCSHKADVKTQLEKTADMLSKTEAGPAPPPSAPEPTAPAPLPLQPATSSQPAAATPTDTPAQVMRQAIASYQAGQMEDAVTRLQKLRTMSTMTAQQRMAVQDSVAAVMNEVYELAAKGDSRAIAAVKQYEDMQTAPRH